MKILKLTTLLLLLIFVLVACSTQTDNNAVEVKEEADPVSLVDSTEGTDSKEEAEFEEEIIDVEPLVIVTTLFPQYDFAKSISGPYGDVRLLLPPGVEAHSYEPTPQDIVLLESADIFIYTGESMEPWASALVENLVQKGVLVVDLSEDMVLLTMEDHHDHHDHGHSHSHSHDHDHGGVDPHYWTDPNMAIIMVKTISEVLSGLMPEQSDFFDQQNDYLISKLNDLDTYIRSMLEKTDSKTILSGGHFAFGYFVNQYGLEHLTPYAGFSPSAEPTPQRIAELIKRARETNARAVFYEELVDPKVSRVIAEEAGLEMLLLHGIHNVSKEELEMGKTYFDFMYENIENLKIGLGYNG